MTTNLFETASREKYRFPSNVGMLNLEQVWDLKLINTGVSHSANRTDLDTVARTINKQLMELKEESFVKTGPNSVRTLLENQLEIVKRIITVKQAEEAAAKKRAADQVELKRLKEIKAAKKQESLLALSEEDVDARIAAIENAA